jgi:hypothetical protein
MAVSGLCEMPHGLIHRPELTADTTKVTVDRDDIYVGSNANDRKGEHLREAFQRINSRFSKKANLELSQDVELPGHIAVIDLNNGEYVRITLFSDVHSLTLANWKPAPMVNRVTLEINSKGTFAVDLPWVTFEDGVNVLFNKDYTVVLNIVSNDAGKTVFCRSVETYRRIADVSAPSKAANIDPQPLKPQR